VKFNDKIEAMLASGKITSEQAHSLKASISGANAPSETSAAEPVCHNTLPTKLIIGVGVAALIGVQLWLSMTGTPTESDPTHTIQTVSDILNQSRKVGAMNTSSSNTISVILLGLPVLLSLIWFTLSYNNLVNEEEDVLGAWGQVEVNYQRRHDLIPNLIKTVEAYAKHEKDTLQGVVSERSTALTNQVNALQKEAASAKVTSQGAAAHLNDDTYMHNLAASEKSLGDALKKTMLLVESYPELKASDNFLELQASLEGTENRIGVARMTFNEKVTAFNASIRKMPTSFIAGFGNFQRKAYFKSDEGAQHAAPVFETTIPAQHP
jgi:LemA protein